MISEPIHVTDETFEKAVLQSPTPIIVDFWAPWCNPCKMVAPILERIAKDYAGKVIVAKVNTDESSQYAQKYGVQGIPTMLFIANGKVAFSIVGYKPEPDIRSAVDEFLDVLKDLK